MPSFLKIVHPDLEAFAQKTFEDSPKGLFCDEGHIVQLGKGMEKPLRQSLAPS